MPDFRSLCAEVLSYYHGEGKYNFSHLSDYDRDNAAFYAWQSIKGRIQSALKDSTLGVTDEKLDELEDLYFYYDSNHSKPWRIFARDVLEHFGCKDPVPILVKERLPEPKDCDDEGQCWQWDPSSDAWVLYTVLGLSLRAEIAPYWLPSHALPLPKVADCPKGC